jgi:hypothetical protein
VPAATGDAPPWVFDLALPHCLLPTLVELWVVLFVDDDEHAIPRSFSRLHKPAGHNKALVARDQRLLYQSNDNARCIDEKQ